MANINIQWVVVSGQLDDLKAYKRQLNIACGKMRTIKSSSAFSKGNMFLYRRRIQSIIDEVQHHSNNMEQLRSSLDQIVQKYRETEKNLCGSGNDASSGTDVQTEPWSEIADKLDDALEQMVLSGLFGPIAIVASAMNHTDILDEGFFEVAGEFGLIGSLAAVAHSGLSAEWEEVGESCFGILGDFAEVMEDGGIKANWQKWLVGDWDLDETSYWDDFNFGKAESAWGKVGVAAEWGGVLVSAIGNYQEYQEEGYSGIESGARTVIETGIDVALEGAIQYGTGAALTALLGTAGAPAVVVGGIAVGVSWGLNAISEHFTGNTIAENLTDGVMWAGDKLADGAEWVGNKIADGYDSLKKGAGKVLENAGDAISGAWADFTSNPLWSW